MADYQEQITVSVKDEASANLEKINAKLSKLLQTSKSVSQASQNKSFSDLTKVFSTVESKSNKITTNLAGVRDSFKQTGKSAENLDKLFKKSTTMTSDFKLLAKSIAGVNKQLKVTGSLLRKLQLRPTLLRDLAKYHLELKNIDNTLIDAGLKNPRLPFDRGIGRYGAQIPYGGAYRKSDLSDTERFFKAAATGFAIYKTHEIMHRAWHDTKDRVAFGSRMNQIGFYNSDLNQINRNIYDARKSTNYMIDSNIYRHSLADLAIYLTGNKNAAPGILKQISSIVPIYQNSGFSAEASMDKVISLIKTIDVTGHADLIGTDKGTNLLVGLAKSQSLLGANLSARRYLTTMTNLKSTAYDLTPEGMVDVAGLAAQDGAKIGTYINDLTTLLTGIHVPKTLLKNLKRMGLRDAKGNPTAITRGIEKNPVTWVINNEDTLLARARIITGNRNLTVSQAANIIAGGQKQVSAAFASAAHNTTYISNLNRNKKIVDKQDSIAISSQNPVNILNSIASSLSDTFAGITKGYLNSFTPLLQSTRNFTGWLDSKSENISNSFAHTNPIKLIAGTAATAYAAHAGIMKLTGLSNFKHGSDKIYSASVNMDRAAKIMLESSISGGIGGGGVGGGGIVSEEIKGAKKGFIRRIFSKAYHSSGLKKVATAGAIVGGMMLPTVLKNKFKTKMAEDILTDSVENAEFLTGATPKKSMFKKIVKLNPKRLIASNLIGLTAGPILSSLDDGSNSRSNKLVKGGLALADIWQDYELGSVGGALVGAGIGAGVGAIGGAVGGAGVGAIPGAAAGSLVGGEIGGVVGGVGGLATGIWNKRYQLMDAGKVMITDGWDMMKNGVSSAWNSVTSIPEMMSSFVASSKQLIDSIQNLVHVITNSYGDSSAYASPSTVSPVFHHDGYKTTTFPLR